MKCIIRIRGNVGLDRKIIETLKRLNLNKKYSCIFLNSTKIEEGMIKKVSDYVAFGDVDNAIVQKMLEKRGKMADKSKKIDAKLIVEKIAKGSTMKKEGLIPYIGLHPPRGGIKTKLSYPKGVLGNHRENIIKLIERML